MILDKNKISLISNSQEETTKIANDFAKFVTRGTNILLSGDLGAGKTFFTNQLMKALKIQDFVNSPTFKIINEYSFNGINIFHFDLYRLESIEEILYLGWEEYLYSENICIIEWAEKAKPIWPENRFEIKIEHLQENNSRKLTIIKVEK